MRPTQFVYHRPDSVADAVKLLSENEGYKALAGGHSLIPAMNLRLNQPDALVDISRLSELKGIRVDGDTLEIGALSTHAQIAASADVQTHAPALARACGLVGDAQVRNWGTLGGNLFHADPASDPPIVVLAYNSIIHLQGEGGRRTVAADDFFIDLYMVDVEPGELITRIEMPSFRSARSAYVKLPHPASRYAVVGVCVVLEVDAGTCRDARVVVGGATPRATLTPGAAAELIGTALDDAALDRAAAALIDDIGDDVMGDMYAPESYRKAMAGVFLKRGVRAALAS